MTMPTRPPAKPALWKVKTVCAADIEPVAIRWLWPDWLAKGKLHILAGAGGTGKTTLLLGLIATLTSGGRWPDGSPCTEPGNALIWSSEDDPADTLIPRLAAAGADLRRVHIIQGRINAQGEHDPFDPANDMELLRATADELGGLALLMLDPIVSAVKGDMHKANDVRRALQGVVDLAEAYGCAVVGISHFAKGTAGGSPAERVVGSQAFSALARTVLVAAKQENSDQRVLARAKSNIGTDEGGVSYTIEPVTIQTKRGPIDATCVAWGEIIAGSAREILGDVEETGEQEERDYDDPGDCLYRILRDNPLESNEAKSLMRRNGYTEKQIRRAREKLSVVVARTGNKRDVKSYWSLPQDGSKSPLVPSDAHSCPALGMGTSRENGHESENMARVGTDPQPFAGAEKSKVLTKVLSPADERLRENVSAFEGDEHLREAGGEAEEFQDAEDL
ncbi:AAA family ATPase [Pseudomonas massiliensis]|uniref:AAA family ATPase n=1 Tax=Pseudomonas massiliensis TaxID=522492 RepID=UPI001E541479|nr:AAA family ATPase [Pseudomonas massiliensis]